MNEDFQSQGANEGGRSRMLATSRQTHRLASPDRERKTSLPTQSNVDINDSHCRSRSITLDGLRVGEQALLTTYTPEASSAKLLSQSTVLRIAVPSQSPSDSTTSPGRCPLERAATADPKLPTRQDTFQSNIIKGDDPRAVRPSESEHREQSVHSGSLELANQETTPQLQETQVPKKRRILEKVLAALRRKKLDLTESVPNELAQRIVGDAVPVQDDGILSVPSAACSFAGNRLDQQAQIHTRSKGVDDSDNDNASFFSAKSSGDDDFYANTSLPPFAEAAGANQAPRSEASSSLNNVGTMTDAAHIDATKAKLPSSTSGSITSFHPSPPGTPGDDPDGGHEVPIESGDMEEMMDDTSPTPSSPGHILASPQPARELGAIQVASSAAAKANPAITGDEDLVNALAEGKGKVQSASLEVGNHESLLSQRTLDSKIIELNIDEQAVSKGRPLGDIGLSHLPVTRGASSVVCSEVEIVQESTHCEIQDSFTSTSANTRGTGREIAVVAQSSPDLALRPELIPLPHDEGDLTNAPESPAHSVVPEQAIRVVESQAVGQASVSRALGAGEEPRLAHLSEDFPASSVKGMQELASSLLQAKHIDLVPDPQTTGGDINTARPLPDAGGESMPPRIPNVNEPANTTTFVQQPPHSTGLVQKGNHMVGPAAQEPADAGIEMLQQFFQMAERIASQSGDSERSSLPQAKPVNLVINVTTNHISSVANGAGGDNYYGPIGQSAIGGQGGHNDISNHQTKEITHTAQLFESQTHLADTIKAH